MRRRSFSSHLGFQQTTDWVSLRPGQGPRESRPLTQLILRYPQTTPSYIHSNLSYRAVVSGMHLAVEKEGPPSFSRRNTPVDYQHHSPTPGARRCDRYEHFGCAPCWNAPSSGVVTLVPNLPFRNPVSLFEDVVVLGGALPPCLPYLFSLRILC